MALKPAITDLARFADLLADGLTPQQAAVQLGKAPGYGNALLQRLRGKVGSQAI